MFTGIIEEVGRVRTVRPQGPAVRLTVAASTVLEATRPGDSIAVSGVCLTVTEIAAGTLAFDAVAETMRRTSLGDLAAGGAVNLERALAVGDRLGGHFVQGHVDGTGRIERIEPAGNSYLLSLSAPPELQRLTVEKGSIAVDGISLTVAGVDEAGFSVSIIPFTWEHTTLAERRVGDRVNLENDLLGKYVDRLLAARLPSPDPDERLRETLARSGFTE